MGWDGAAVERPAQDCNAKPGERHQRRDPAERLQAEPAAEHQATQGRTAYHRHHPEGHAPAIGLADERAGGPLRDSSLRARRLGESRLLVVAAPEYLERHGTPRKPAELVHHNCLSFNFRRTVGSWRFAMRTAKRPVEGNIEASNGETLRQLTLAGVGLARLATFHVSDDVRKGDLVVLFERNGPDEVDPIHAVWIDRPYLSGRIRAFIDFLAGAVSPRLIVANRLSAKARTKGVTVRGKEET